MQVTVRYFAGAQAAAGTGEETLEVPADLTLDQLCTELTHRHGAALERVLAAAAFLVNEVATAAEQPIAPDAQVDVLPPFAGG